MSDLQIGRTDGRPERGTLTPPRAARAELHGVRADRRLRFATLAGPKDADRDHETTHIENLSARGARPAGRMSALENPKA